MPDVRAPVAPTTAIVLAAGRSSRLGTLCQHVPKPMLALGDRPVLAWTLARLRAAGIRDVIINLHHRGEVIRSFFGDGSRWGLEIVYRVEPKILGTAGAVRNARHLLQHAPFLVVYGDNVLDWDPTAMLAEHRARGPLATIAVAEVRDPSGSGVVVFDASGAISRFVEKPGNRPALGRWVNAGVYVLDAAIFEYIGEGFADFGFEIFPDLLARGLPLRCHQLAAPPLAIDTPAQYAAAQDAWSVRSMSVLVRSPTVATGGQPRSVHESWAGRH